MSKRQSLEGRFWAKVDKSAGPDGCWLWIGGHGDYGHFWDVPNHRNIGAHRFSYQLAFGPIPDKLWCLHKCDTPLCVNPKHLFVGTPTDNMQDAKRKGHTTTGDKNGMRKHPEKAARGDRSGARLHPEKLARGDRNGTRLHPERVPKGERARSAKLTEEQVLQIRAMYGVNGENTYTLAKRFGVSAANTAYIIRRKTWKHI